MRITEEMRQELETVPPLMRGKWTRTNYGDGLHSLWCDIDGTGYGTLMARTCCAAGSFDHAEYIANALNALPSLLADSREMAERLAAMEREQEASKQLLIETANFAASQLRGTQVNAFYLFRDVVDKRDNALRLLRRIREWDQLPQTADGAYWQAEIDAILTTEDT
jgi:hypothetical protein